MQTHRCGGMKGEILMLNYTLKFEQDSDAENYFLNTLISVCKDEVVCRLGDLFGWSYDEFIISQDDFNRCCEFIMVH